MPSRVRAPYLYSNFGVRVKELVSLIAEPPPWPKVREVLFASPLVRNLGEPVAEDVLAAGGGGDTVGGGVEGEALGVGVVFEGVEHRGEREDEAAGGLEIGGRGDVGAAGEAGAVGEDEAGEDHGAEIGGGAGGDLSFVVGVGDVLLLGADGAAADAEADAEALVQEHIGVVELVVGAPLAVVVIIPAAGLAEVGGVGGVEAGAEGPIDAAAFAIKGAAGAHVDGAGGRIGFHVGAEGAADLDGFDGVNRHLFEANKERDWLPAAPLRVAP